MQINCLLPRVGRRALSQPRRQSLPHRCVERVWCLLSLLWKGSTWRGPTCHTVCARSWQLSFSGHSLFTVQSWFSPTQSDVPCALADVFPCRIGHPSSSTGVSSRMMSVARVVLDMRPRHAARATDLLQNCSCHKLAQTTSIRRLRHRSHSACAWRGRGPPLQRRHRSCSGVRAPSGCGAAPTCMRRELLRRRPPGGACHHGCRRYWS